MSSPSLYRWKIICYYERQILPSRVLNKNFTVSGALHDIERVVAFGLKIPTSCVLKICCHTSEPRNLCNSSVNERVWASLRFPSMWSTSWTWSASPQYQLDHREYFSSLSSVFFGLLDNILSVVWQVDSLKRRRNGDLPRLVTLSRINAGMQVDGS